MRVMFIVINIYDDFTTLLCLNLYAPPSLNNNKMNLSLAATYSQINMFTIFIMTKYPPLLYKIKAVRCFEHMNQKNQTLKVSEHTH